MHEELKTALLLLLSPFLISIIVFILKKFLLKYEKQQKEILQSIQKLNVDLLNTANDLKTISNNFTRLETSYLSQSKFIDKEICNRNARFDVQNKTIVELQKQVAIINEKLKVFT